MLTLLTYKGRGVWVALLILEHYLSEHQSRYVFPDIVLSLAYQLVIGNNIYLLFFLIAFVVLETF